MELMINGNQKHVQAELNTVAKLLASLQLAQKTVIVERNQQILQKEDHPYTALADGDVLEIVHFVGGG